ncbi:MAG: TadE/TadG family type IV pilus assembly protein [Planktotalea sp.]|uniref:TadE/TadG family type IV pilus assembly protein n=1 Tax=Planktotalea sp. TaxID=2029877 RepID=UPI003C7349CA
MLKSLKTHFSTLYRKEDGAVAIEFTLLAPILFALLFGIICIGYAIGISHSIHQLATSAARASLEGITTAERKALADTYLANAGQYFPLLDASAIDAVASVTEGDAAHISIQVSYALDASVLSIANGFLGLEMSDLSAGAYLAY